MKIGNITFSGAHNYGSVLQAYALQTFIKRIVTEHGENCEYQILNFRTPFQKALYSQPQPNSAKSFFKWLMYMPYRSKLNTQHMKFEQFMSNYLHLTDEFSSEKNLPDFANQYDVLLAGSDQIWNVRARDFSYAYLYEKCTPPKVSYATSLGPLQIDWEQYDSKRYLNAVKAFSSISVRETKSKDMLSELFPELSIDVHVDPTLLLTVDEWRMVQSDMKANDSKYILFYCLEPTRDHIRLAKLLSKATGLPVVSTKYRNKSDYFSPFIKLYDAGPRDFLSLVDHASMILTSSFHGTAFSLIYGKPFYAIDGMKDGRISNILRMANAECNSIGINDEGFTDKPKAIDVKKWIDTERDLAKEYILTIMSSLL